MKNFLWIARYLKPYWVYALMNVIANIFSVIFDLFSISMVVPFLGLLFGTQKLVTEHPVASAFSASGLLQYVNYYISQIIITYGKSDALLFVCIMVATMVLLKNTFRYLGMYFIAPVRNGVSKDMRNEIHNKILALPLSYFSDERKGDIMARTTSDVQEIEWTILSSLEAMFRDPFNVFAFLFALLYMSPQLTVFILIMLPFSGLVIGLIGKSLKKTSAKGQQQMGVLLSIIEESLSGLRIVKAFTAERQVGEKFEKANSDYGKLMIRMYRKRDLASPLSEFMGVVVMVVVMWYGGQLIFKGQNALEANVFIAYIALFTQILSPIKSITTAFSNIKKGVASADRVRVILDAPLVIVDKPNAKSISTFTEGISYNNISFAYRNYDNEPVLTNVSINIPIGKTVALVGQSGSGKSTLADLLPRFYDVQEGNITIDGHDTRDIKIKDLRALMGNVTQESILFNDTVFNNIAFGMQDATEKDVIQAAKIANAHDFIIDMENGYQTNIGDRGGKLSGGQRQRISIARAVLKNPPILILDEATSALDTESERLVQDALTKLMKNRTTLVIAHRLSTIQHADEIIVLQKGKIMERGNHESLLNTNGVYKRLHDMQAFS
jgi:subfamily B ATP-binding cassette protein MsbA